MQNLGAILFALTVAGYPLVSSLPFLLDLDSRVTSIPYRAVVLALSLIIIACQLKTGISSRSSSIFYLFWVFWLIYFVRLLFDTIIIPITLYKSSGEYLLFAIGVTFIPMVAFYFVTKITNLKLALHLTIIILTMAAILCLMQIRNEYLAGNNYYFLTKRFATETLNPVSLGHVGGSLGILSLFTLLREKSIVYKLLYCGLFIFGVFILVITASKGPILAFLFVVAVMFIINFKKRITLSDIILGVFIIAAVCFVTFFVQDKLGFGVISRFLPENEDRSVSSRLVMMGDAWSQFLDNPVLGSAMLELNSGSYPHNIIIESFMATGLYGGVVFAALMVTTFFVAFKILLINYKIGWIPLIYLQYLLGAQISGFIPESETMWCYMCAVIVLYSISKANIVPMIRSPYQVTYNKCLN
jgi:O-antigen ligase